MKVKLVANNYLGLALVVSSIIVFVVLLTVSLDYAKIAHVQCGSEYCSVANHIPIQSYAGFSLLAVTAGLGSYFAFLSPKSESIQTLSKSKANKILQSLKGEEKTVFDNIAKNEGSVFQQHLIDATGFSKVKVSRILDRLETKNLVERRRRGMSNVVVVKV